VESDSRCRTKAQYTLSCGKYRMQITLTRKLTMPSS